MKTHQERFGNIFIKKFDSEMWASVKPGFSKTAQRMLKLEDYAMSVLKRLTIWIAGFCLFSYAVNAAAVCKNDFVPDGTPLAKIDLATEQGVKLVKGVWRYSDVKIIESDFLDAGPDGQPGVKPNRAYDFEPHAGGRGFDDASWEVIGPTNLSQRRSAGKLSFNWYRIRITIPERVGGFDPTGSTLVFQTSVDDYAEIWVDGELPRLFGQCGGSMVMG